MGDKDSTNLVEALVSHYERERHIVKGDTGATPQLGSFQSQRKQ
jgi:hypothetical protein